MFALRVLMFSAALLCLVGHAKSEVLEDTCEGERKIIPDLNGMLENYDQFLKGSWDMVLDVTVYKYDPTTDMYVNVPDPQLSIRVPQWEALAVRDAKTKLCARVGEDQSFEKWLDSVRALRTTVLKNDARTMEFVLSAEEIVTAYQERMGPKSAHYNVHGYTDFRFDVTLRFLGMLPPVMHTDDGIWNDGRWRPDNAA